MWFFKRKKQPVKIVNQRAFAAAQVSNLLNKWQTTVEQIDADLQQGGRALRARARNMAKNNGYAKKYLEILKTNVVGKDGIGLQVKSKNKRGKLDTVANAAVESAWQVAGGYGEFDVTGKMSRLDGQRLFIASAARDGEVLLRIYRGFKNAAGFAVQFLDPDLLDEDHNEDLTNGKYIRMGVEFNSNGFPIAYHLTPIRNDRVRGKSYRDNRNRNRNRVPAEDIIHAYLPEYANQSRGYTWMHAAMVNLHHLSAFEEAAIIAARIGASSMGFFTEQFPDNMAPDDYTGADIPVMDVEPGTFRKLPMGVDFKMFESKYPEQMVDSFITRELKSTASALNVTYNSLASDPERTSYGTLRGFSIEERDYFRTLQVWVSRVFLQRLYFEWLPVALSNGSINLPESSYQKLIDISWKPRGWQWIDPAKDANAYQTMLENKLISRSQIASEQGRDFEEICQQIAADDEMMKKYKLQPMEASNATT